MTGSSNAADVVKACAAAVVAASHAEPYDHTAFRRALAAWRAALASQSPPMPLTTTGGTAKPDDHENRSARPDDYRSGTPEVRGWTSPGLVSYADRDHAP